MSEGHDATPTRRIPAPPATDSTLHDLAESFRRARLWRFLAWREIVGQYDRTLIGALWVPLNVLIHVSFLGFIFSTLFEGERYFPHFAVGYAVWAVIARVISESATLWETAERYILHMKVPLSVFLFKLVFKSALLMGMTLPAGYLVAAVAGARPTWDAWLAVPGAALLLVNLFWAGAIYSVIGLRLRDIAKFTPSLIIILYLATPIVWEPERLRDHAWIADLNPFYHWIELVRAPLVGDGFPARSWAISGGLAAGGGALAFTVFARTRRRLVLWL